MKLQRLYLRNYKVLRDLDIEFSPATEAKAVYLPNSSYNLDFLVGVNGTGKSTVLRVLSDLICKLERYAPIEYGFELEYTLGTGDTERTIRLSNLPEDLEDLELEEDNDNQSLETLIVEENDEPASWSRDLLPEIVVAFTTGNEESWKKLEDSPSSSTINSNILQSLSPEDRFIQELPESVSQPSPSDQTEESNKFLFIKDQQLPLVILCGLLADLAHPEESQRLRQVLSEAKISKMSGFSLKFRVIQGRTSQEEMREVERLRKLADRSLHLGSDRRLVFDLSDLHNTKAQTIVEEFANGLELFRTLSNLAVAGEDGQPVLREVSIFLERTPEKEHEENETTPEPPPLHLLEWLSDGERSFLARMCLFTLLGAKEALILLDEPEVHFNDYWKRQIVQFLDETLKDRNSHILITTHSSITLTDALRENILVLDRNGNYTDNWFNPGLRTVGADPSDIMVHVFGSPHPAGTLSVHRLEEELENTLNRDSDERQQHLEYLLRNVVAQGYWSYAIRRELKAIKEG